MDRPKGFVLTDRDYIVFREISRWRFLLARQIKALTGFAGKSVLYERLKKLIDAEYIERRYILYGVPALYFITVKVSQVVPIRYVPAKVKLEQIQHDIAVVDSVIFFRDTMRFDLANFLSEKELHSIDGFNNRKHQPDFVYKFDDEQKICFEVELTAKSKTRFMKNVADNYMNYDNQYWIIPKNALKVRSMVEEAQASYPNIHIIPLETVERHAKEK